MIIMGQKASCPIASERKPCRLLQAVDLRFQHERHLDKSLV